METSWHESFADRYAEWSAGRTADIPFYTALAREADGPVVELAVGSGRVAIPVARATGRTVIGIDLTLDGGGTSSMWWATKNEWLGLLDVAGLKVEALYGGFAGEPFTGERAEYGFVGRHRRADD